MGQDCPPGWSQAPMQDPVPRGSPTILHACSKVCVTVMVGSGVTKPVREIVRTGRDGKRLSAIRHQSGARGPPTVSTRNNGLVNKVNGGPCWCWFFAWPARHVGCPARTPCALTRTRTRLVSAPAHTCTTDNTPSSPLATMLAIEKGLHQPNEHSAVLSHQIRTVHGPVAEPC